MWIHWILRCLSISNDSFPMMNYEQQLKLKLWTDIVPQYVFNPFSTLLSRARHGSNQANKQPRTDLKALHCIDFWWRQPMTTVWRSRKEQTDPLKMNTPYRLCQRTNRRMARLACVAKLIARNNLNAIDSKANRELMERKKWMRIRHAICICLPSLDP